MIPPAWRLRPPDGLSDEITRALLQITEERLGAVPIERVLVWAIEQQSPEVLQRIAETLGLDRLTWLSADAAPLLVEGVAAAAGLGTPAMVEQAVASLGLAAWCHEDTRLLCDGSWWADGAFTMGSHRHWAAFWLVVVAKALSPEQRVAVTRMVDAAKRRSAHLKEIYLVDDAGEFGDTSRYRTGPWSPTGLAAVWHWWRGDDPDAVIVDGAYAEVPDRGSQGGVLVQTTPARRPLVSSRWRPGPAPDFDVEAGALVHSSPAADWSWLHDAETEALLLLRARRDPNVSGGTVLATSRFVSLETGIHLRTISGGRLELAVTNGSGGSVYALSTATGNNAWLPGEVATVVLHKQGASWSIAVGGAEVLTGEATGAVATAPTRSLCLGTVLSEPNAGSVVEAIICRGPVDARDRTRLESYLERWEYIDE